MTDDDDEPDLPAVAFCPATGKVRHPSRKRAAEELNRYRAKLRLRNKPRGALIVYRCRACGGHHIGNNLKDYGPRAGRPKVPPPEPVLDDDEEAA